MKKYVNSADAVFPKPAKIKNRWLFIIKHSKAISFIACLLHHIQNIFLKFSHIKFLNI